MMFLHYVPQIALVRSLSFLLILTAIPFVQPLSAHAEDKNTPWGPVHDGDQTDNGTRGGCPKAVDVPLTALLPDTHFGQTWSTAPTMWFYVPYSSEQIAYGELSLLNSSGFDVVDPIPFTLPDQAGFVSITLPENHNSEPLLENGADYFWAFQLYCQRETFDPIYVGGWLQMNAPTEQDQVALAVTDPDQYQVYWNNGIWFDAVNALAQQRLQQPSDPELDAAWLRLLQDGGVDVEALPLFPVVGEVKFSDQEVN